MARSPVLAPSPAEKQGLLALLELGVGWCRAYAITHPLVLSIQHAVVGLREYVAGAAGRTKFDAVAAALGAPGSRVVDPSGQTPEGALRAVGDLRDAALLALGLTTMEPVPEKAFGEYRRQMFLHLENAGSYLAIERCTDAVRLAYEGALQAARDTRKQAVSAPVRTRLIARGQLLALLRQRRQRSPEELVLAVREAGGTLSVAQLARVENGTAGLDVANLPALPAALQVHPSWVDQCVDLACAAAARFAGQSMGVQGDDWYAQVCALQGGEDAVARAMLLTMVASALYRPSNSSVV